MCIIHFFSEPRIQNTHVWNTKTLCSIQNEKVLAHKTLPLGEPLAACPEGLYDCPCTRDGSFSCP